MPLISPILLLFVLALIGAIVIRSVSVTAHAPQSVAYLTYRRRLRRNLLIATAIPAVAALGGIIGGIISASRGEPNLGIPGPLAGVLQFIVWPGLWLFPLIALLVTELRTHPASQRVATLEARTPRTLAPGWLWALSLAAGVLGIGAPLLGLTTLDDDFDFAPTVGSNPGLSGVHLWPQALYALIGLVVAGAVVYLVDRRPDLDPDTSSDRWSRRAVVSRALGLATIGSLSAVAEALDALNDAAIDYRNHLQGGGAVIDSWQWLSTLNIASVTSWGLIVVLVTFAAVLVVICAPPRPRRVKAPREPVNG